MHPYIAKSLVGVEERLDREPRLTYLPDHCYENTNSRASRWKGFIYAPWLKSRSQNKQRADAEPDAENNDGEEKATGDSSDPADLETVDDD